MDNLIFCLNVTVPIFLTLLLGYFFRRIGLFDEAFVNRMNKFVFVIPLPVLLFQDIAKIDIYEAWDSKMVIFCFLITSVSIIISVLLSRLLHPSDIRGEFIQASYRSSAAILGIAVIQNLYGNAGMAPLMIIASVPLYNVMAVVVLSVFKPDQGKLDGTVLKRTLKGIVTNPIILGIVAGTLWSLLRLPFPKILDSTVGNLAKTATPLGLMAMGGSLHFGKAFSQSNKTSFVNLPALRFCGRGFRLRKIRCLKRSPQSQWQDSFRQFLLREPACWHHYGVSSSLPYRDRYKVHN